MSKIGIVGIGKSRAEYIGDLTRTLMEICKNEDTNPINLGITMEEYIKMNEVVLNPEKKSNGFLEGKKMNKILGKRK